MSVYILQSLLFNFSTLYSLYLMPLLLIFSVCIEHSLPKKKETMLLTYDSQFSTSLYRPPSFDFSYPNTNRWLYYKEFYKIFIHLQIFTISHSSLFSYLFVSLCMCAICTIILQITHFLSNLLFDDSIFFHNLIRGLRRTFVYHTIHLKFLSAISDFNKFN